MGGGEGSKGSPGEQASHLANKPGGYPANYNIPQKVMESHWETALSMTTQGYTGAWGKVGTE